MRLARTASFLAAGALAAALVPATASASEIEIVSSKEPIAAGQLRGWAYYCPAHHPYLATIEKGSPDHGYSYREPKWRDLSSSWVTAAENPLRTSRREGMLVITFTNWNPFRIGEQQVAYSCTDQL